MILDDSNTMLYLVTELIVKLSFAEVEDIYKAKVLLQELSSEELDTKALALMQQIFTLYQQEPKE